MLVKDKSSWSLPKVSTNCNRLDGVGPTTAINNYDAEYTYKGNNLLSTAKLRNGNMSEYTYDGLKLKIQDNYFFPKTDQNVKRNLTSKLITYRNMY
ncbi:hypothetical protein SAMN03159341_13815 [Paenibacillus sp. 1_12]|uniref:hypothetical protein n=1 Tax=Paenibacillus sp. 1_12 TaxID=1566278 RepID=UPI0008E4CD7B|nr:hypothetical protein [Paenibacillus sp. 1_12]SFM49226.1 hypothetical protein SAMN03159341_13815 [Paenibacillus sp. 1_12]